LAAGAGTLALAIALGGCGGGNQEKLTNSTSSAASQATAPTATTASTVTTPPAPSGATTSTAQPKHPKGGPKSANLPSNNAPDNAITQKTGK
jgi:hypothetical protein